MGASSSIYPIEEMYEKSILDIQSKHVFEKVTFEFSNHFYNKFKDINAYKDYSQFLKIKQTQNSVHIV
jgi:hypothetical protein